MTQADISTPVLLSRENRVAIITINNPPVNALSQPVRAGLLAVLSAIRHSRRRSSAAPAIRTLTAIIRRSARVNCQVFTATATPSHKRTTRRVVTCLSE
jgi:hypothetical protein